MTGLLELADVLDRAADLIAAPGTWTQGALAETKIGRRIGPTENNATCWCALGAIRKAGGYESDYNPAALSLGAYLFAPIADWNDAPERTQEEVVAMLRAAALRARATLSESSPT